MFDDAIINNKSAHFNFIHILINIAWQWLSLIEWKSLITWGMFVNVSLIVCLYAYWITAHAPPLLESYPSPWNISNMLTMITLYVAPKVFQIQVPPQYIFLRKPDVIKYNVNSLLKDNYTSLSLYFFIPLNISSM